MEGDRRGYLHSIYPATSVLEVMEVVGGQELPFHHGIESASSG